MKISRRAANGILSSAHFIAWYFRRSASVKSSSFLVRNESGPSNARLLSTVSMWKTFSVFSTRSPWRLNECDSYDYGGDKSLAVGLCGYESVKGHPNPKGVREVNS